jgi:hexosaminidase
MPIKIKFSAALFFILFAIVGCNSQKNKAKFGDQIFITWELQSNFSPNDGQSLAVFTFENKSKSILRAANWKIYFNQTTLRILQDKTPKIGIVEHVNGDLYRIVPNEKFELKPGEKISLSYAMNGAIISEDEAPAGLYYVVNENTNEQQIELVSNYVVFPLVRYEQMNRGEEDHIPVATPQYCYIQNQLITPVSADNIKQIIPSPVSINEGNGKFQFSKNTKIIYDKTLKNEAQYLQSILSKALNGSISITEGNNAGKTDILLMTTAIKIKEAEKEAYRLEVSEKNGLTIDGNDAAGVFYGIQSLLALFPLDIYKHTLASFEVNEIIVEDAPRFIYRGLMLDVARHFHSKKTIERYLDLLAYYKINHLQLLLSDDEGWRIEIPGLPELTDVGSKRGHAGDGYECLMPNFGIGPFPDANVYGNGYFTKNDFIEILKYATQRHITIVPEICVPGHARAAIMSMENRYLKYMKEGKESEATEYRLRDVNDTSKYHSAQYYNDNVVCIGMESTYRFYEKVVTEIQNMYQEAGVPMEYFHTGGDEVPSGAWLGSPMCDTMIGNNDKVDVLKIQAKFFSRIYKMFEKYNTKVCGWEEIAMVHDKDGNALANPDFKANAIPYIWNNIWGNEDLSYKLANAGYKIVLCNVSNFYFDLSYEKHPKETGLHWGGFVGAKQAFDFSPFDVFKSTHYNGNMGEAFTAADAAGMEKLKPEAQKIILGVQAQLWAETIIVPELIDYDMLPKLIGFAETAWAPQRAWESLFPDELRQKSVDKDWNIFANSIGLRELKRLDYLWGGFSYRIPPAGAKIKEGYLYANTEFPGFTIRYTTDNSEPNANSIIYTEPVKVKGTVKLAVFNDLGRSSRIVEVGNE